MTPEQIAKMQAGKQAAAAAKKIARDRIDGDDTAAWQERHDRARKDLLEARKTSPAWAAHGMHSENP